MKRNLLKYCLMAVMVFFSIRLVGGVNFVNAATSDNGDGTFSNPVIFADVPDEDIIRVGDTYYMISTTMHMSPGAPIMKSYDLVNWEIVNYVYNYLEEDDKRSLKNGESDYAYGSWAASLRYDPYQKKFYVTFSSQTTPKSYFFITDDIENGSWHRSETEKCYDSSFLFVDTGTECKKYMIIPVATNGTTENGVAYDGNRTEMCELIVDEQTWDVSLGIERTPLIDYNNYELPRVGLAAEGVHAYKIGEYYYFFMIQGAGNPVRQQICWRSKTLEHGTFECRKVFTGGIIDEDGKTVNSSWGVAQGGIVQTPEGDWYSLMFQDYHSVGRIPVLVPLVWDEDGWPVFGNNGKSVNKVLPMPVSAKEPKFIVQSDEFDNGTVHKLYDGPHKEAEKSAGILAEELENRLDEVEENEFGYNGSNLKLEWQWNHNPNNNLWSLTDRDGYLRLKSGQISKNIRTARNTLTQRTFGPTSGASIAIEIGNMRDGDVAGLAAFQNQYGFVGIKMEDGQKYLVMHRAIKAGDADGAEQERIELSQDRVYLKVNCDYRENTALNSTWRMRDEAYFYYSLDGGHWLPIGDKLSMSYDWPDFMGYRFGIFYFSTQTCGGYVDVDYFHVSTVDGKKRELQNIIEDASSIERQSYYSDEQWNHFTEALENAKIQASKLPEYEDNLTLTEIEENNQGAYIAINRLREAITSIQATVKPVQPEQPLQTAAPNSNAQVQTSVVPAPVPTAIPASVISKKIAVKAAGYPFTKSGIYLAKGAKTRLKATITPSNTDQKKVIYTSSRKSVVSITSNGVIKAIRPGTAKITAAAQDGGAKTVIRVNVTNKKKPNKLLKAAKQKISLKKGKKADFPLKKQTTKTTSSVTYQSLNKKTATIDAYGTILGKNKGKAKVKAICGKKSVTITVTVS